MRSSLSGEKKRPTFYSESWLEDLVPAVATLVLIVAIALVIEVRDYL